MRSDQSRSNPSAAETIHAFDVNVVFTTFEGTRLAIQEADRIAGGLNARITVVVPDVIPYHLPLDRPYLAGSFLKRQLEAMASETRAVSRVEIYMCRDHEPLLRRMLQTDSVVVIGTTHRHWHWRESRLRRLLMRMGHEVLLVTPRRTVFGPGVAASSSARPT